VSARTRPVPAGPQDVVVSNSFIGRAFDRLGLVGIAAIGLIVYAIFLIAPIFLTIFYSFTDWDGLSPTFEFTWLDNFERAISDPLVQHAWIVTAVIAVTVTVLVNVIGLGLALLLRRSTRSALVYRSIFFYPIVLSSIVVGILWRELLNTNGIISQQLGALGLPFIPFLADPLLSVVSITMVTVWQLVAFTMVIYLAGLTTVRQDLVDASSIDGAGPWQVFRYVTFPALAPAVTLNTVFMLIATMKEYDQVVAMTAGGPVHASETVAYKILQDGLSGDEFGYGSAQAVLLFLGVAIIATGVILRLRRREEHLT
jgi:multiple sugar transport system permease protein/raffinose/stachyose/melibiose transport system permease protein